MANDNTYTIFEKIDDKKEREMLQGITIVKIKLEFEEEGIKVIGEPAI